MTRIASVFCGPVVFGIAEALSTSTSAAPDTAIAVPMRTPRRFRRLPVGASGATPAKCSEKRPEGVVSV
ncbi:MAG: hypothetical protein ACHQJ7_00830 [Vicinamibacteria bacterium]